MDKNKREKENIYKWACKYSDIEKEKYFTNIDKDQVSYFIQRVANKEIQEYKFENANELKEILNEQWKDDLVFDEIVPTILVAALKNKTTILEDEDCGMSKTDELPTFIYNF